MHFAQRNLNQDITYWGISDPVVTNDFGQTIPTPPILIKGRWQSKVQQVRKNNGEEITSMAEVLVDRDLDLGGYLKLGDHTGNVNPDIDASEIQQFATTPDLRNLGNERRAYL